MTVSLGPKKCAGHKYYGTVVIKYEMPAGMQKEYHDNKEEPFKGISRNAYLLDNGDGR
jgi:hypothetical protein